MAEPTVAVLSTDTVFHGRYRVVRCIRAGGMGAVYEVIDERTESPRALKVMLPSLVENAGLRERFEREAKVTGAIESDHLVRVLDAGVDDATSTPFLVMELLRGEEMGALLSRRTKLPPAEVVLCLSQVARALEKTHAAGIIHRDLKPENLFITQRDDGTPCVKILDFGIAKVVVESNQAARTTRLVGTPLYMAPEQIRGDATIGPTADIHALAHVAYALLTGEPYWTDESDSTALYGLLTKILGGLDEPPSARSLRRRGVELPPGFDAWMQAATARDAADRFPGAMDAVMKLGALVGVNVSRPSLPEILTVEAPAQLPPAFAPTEPAPVSAPPASSPAETLLAPAAPAVSPVAPSVGAPTSWLPSDPLIILLRSLGRREFIARYAGLYMVFVEGEARVPITFHTAAIEVGDKQKLEAMMAKPGEKRDYTVMAIVKAPGHPYPDRISVGRARNCDLVIRDFSVSKLHAHFKQRHNGKFDLVDLGSQNGTFVNGNQLKPNQPEPVWPGDYVAFGNVCASLLDAGALYDLCK